MCLSLAMILFSVFSVSSYWFDVPRSLYRVLVIYPFSRPMRCFCTMDGSLKNDSPVGVLLLFAHLFLVPLALITPCQSVIVRYLHLAREYPSAQFTQHRGAVLIVPCYLFVCRFFVDLTNNGPIAVVGDTVLRT